MSHTEKEIEELRRGIQHLEYQIELLTSIADPDKRPFIHFALETNLTRAQVRQFFDLMEDVRQSIQQGKPMDRVDFEKRILLIVPGQDYHFAELVVSTLNDEGRYTEVYDHMKKSGMNI